MIADKLSQWTRFVENPAVCLILWLLHFLLLQTGLNGDFVTDITLMYGGGNGADSEVERMFNGKPHTALLSANTKVNLETYILNYTVYTCKYSLV